MTKTQPNITGCKPACPCQRKYDKTQAKTYEDLKALPIGTILEFENPNEQTEIRTKVRSRRKPWLLGKTLELWVSEGEDSGFTASYMSEAWLPAKILHHPKPTKRNHPTPHNTEPVG